MLCEKCLNQEATVFFSQVVDGEVTDMQLCESCAKEFMEQLPKVRWTEHPAAEDKAYTSQSSNGGPCNVVLPDPVRVGDLAAVLEREPHEVIGALMQLNKFATLNTEIDFVTASAVCSRFGITPRRKDA